MCDRTDLHWLDERRARFISARFDPSAQVMGLKRRRTCTTGSPITRKRTAARKLARSALTMNSAHTRADSGQRLPAPHFGY
jgi:hypothetical protein